MTEITTSYCFSADELTLTEFRAEFEVAVEDLASKGFTEDQMVIETFEPAMGRGSVEIIGSREENPEELKTRLAFEEFKALENNRRTITFKEERIAQLQKEIDELAGVQLESS